MGPCRAHELPTGAVESWWGMVGGLSKVSPPSVEVTLKKNWQSSEEEKIVVKRVMTGRSGRSRTYWKRWLHGVRISGLKTSSFCSTTNIIQVNRPTDETAGSKVRNIFY